MPYGNFGPADDPLAIAELKHATAHEVRFTGFSSCLGLLALNGANNVRAVHVPMFGGPDNTPCANVNIDEAIAVLGATAGVIVVGQVDAWRTLANGVRPVYEHLIARLQAPRIISVDDGVYGGWIAGNALRAYRYVNGNRTNL
jgi:hypothetical protein